MSRSMPLARTLNLVEITLYGIGTIIGAGIYVLIGEVAAAAATYTAVAFVLAAAIVSLSGYSYAQLSRRLPVCAGAAAYVLEAFGSRSLAAVTGALVLFVSIVSAATLANGFTDYLLTFFPDNTPTGRYSAGDDHNAGRCPQLTSVGNRRGHRHHGRAVGFAAGHHGGCGSDSRCVT